MNKKLFMPKISAVKKQVKILDKFFKNSSVLPAKDMIIILAGLQQRSPKDWKNLSYEILKGSELNLLSKDITEVLCKFSNGFALNLKYQFIEELLSSVEFSKEIGLNNKQILNGLRETITARKDFIEDNFQEEINNRDEFLN